MISYVSRCLLVLSLCLPGVAHAYGEGGDAKTYVRKGGTYGAPAQGGGVNAATTRAVVNLLTGGVRGCQRLGKVYRYDCYRQVYGQAAAQMNGIAGYSEARRILTGVERSLTRTVNRNLDRRAPQVQAGAQRFRAIRAESLPTAKAAFVAALEEAETQLLRSAPSGGEHLVRIAEALNSNKILLRSALLLLRMVA